MEPGDLTAEQSHSRKAWPSLRCHAVIKAFLIEAAHDEHPFHRLPSPTDLEDSVFSVCYRNDLKIEFMRRAAVYLALEAGGAALFERPEIEKRVFIDLVGPEAREEQPPTRVSQDAQPLQVQADRLPASLGNPALRAESAANTCIIAASYHFGRAPWGTEGRKTLKN
jgi:hypothetical protein